MFKEFREFALKGNAFDLAVGIIIGAAFTTIVQSLVNDMLMPPIGVLMGGVDFSNYFIRLDLDDAMPVSLEAATTDGIPVIAYGKFINALVNFVLVALALFLVIKQVNKVRARISRGEETVSAPPRQEVLLEEIRDLLKTKA